MPLSTPETIRNFLDGGLNTHYYRCSRNKPMRKVALTEEWDLIQLQDDEGAFAILFNVATYETREVQCKEDLLAVLSA